MALRERIFTKSMDLNLELGSATYPPGAGWLIAGLTWQPEEDVVLMGYQANAIVGTINQNDGQAYAAFECTQAPNVGLGYGRLFHVEAQEYWNTTPAGIMICEADEAVMFPEGEGIPVPEGTSVNIHVRWHAKSAGTGELSLRAVLFYARGRCRV